MGGNGPSEQQARGPETPPGGAAGFPRNCEPLATARLRPVEQEPQHPLEAARDDLDEALPLLTGDPMSTAASLVQQSGKRESLEEWTDDALLHQSAREVLITVAIIARAMMVKPTLAVAKPAETGILVRALAGCLKAATAVLSEQPTGNPRK